jgi:MoaA/NifB/PqqE/SkfB family radical SAM enzyme
MPNLLLTTTCNRRCPYCFALEALEGSPGRAMTFGEIVDLADRALASDVRTLGLLGGEPTLHPEFAEIALYLVRRGIAVRAFTNGLRPVDGLDELAGAPRERFLFVVNVNAPEIEVPGNHDRQVEFLRRFPKVSDLGVNVFRGGLDLSFLLEVAERAGLEGGWIRVGLAQPIAGEANVFLRPEDYRAAVGPIVRLAEAAIGRGIRVSLDCGFPLCTLTDEEVGRLYRLGANLKFVCQPAVDVAPGGEAWSCFPLARATRVPYDARESLRDLAEAFRRRHEEERRRRGAGIFPECGTCLQREIGRCDGGCLAHLVGPGNAGGSA